MHPESYYVGLQSGVQKVTAGKPFTVAGVVVDWNGKLLRRRQGAQAARGGDLRLEADYGYDYDEDERLVALPPLPAPGARGQHHGEGRGRQVPAPT